MRDQYVGDISDLLKIGLLRALAGADRTLGVAWYYVPSHDGRPDGRHTEWQHQPAWACLDGPLYGGLVGVQQSVAALEGSPVWPNGTLFHREPKPLPVARAAWAEQKRHTLQAANVIFLDPDNGLGAPTEQHATYAEVQLLREPEQRSIVFITFPGRNLPHEIILTQLHHRLFEETHAIRVATLRINVSVPLNGGPLVIPRTRWFTIVDPNEVLIARMSLSRDALINLNTHHPTLHVHAHPITITLNE